MDGQGLGSYCVDIAMCIDATGSMGKVIENVKESALNFYQLFIEEMEKVGKEVDQLRIKVIAFGDYKCDAEPMRESEFFVLPDQNEAFRDFVANIKANGGGDQPENALEAVSLAMKSDWTTEGDTQRHVILVFSDAPALELGARAECPGYPTDLPKSLAELGAWWAGTDQSLSSTYKPYAGRLVAFVPNAYPWSDMQAWNRYWPAFSTKAGIDLTDVDIYSAIDLLVGSINKTADAN